MIKFTIFCVFVLALFLLMYLVHGGIRKSTYPMEQRYLHSRYLIVYIVLLIALCNRYTYAYLLIAVSKLINMPSIQSFWNAVLPLRRLKIVYLCLNYALTNLLLLFVSGIVFRVIHFLFRNHTDYVDTKDQSIGFKMLHLPWVLARRFYTNENEEGGETTVYHVTDKGFTTSLWVGRMKFAFLLWGIAEMVFFVVSIFTDSEYLLENATPIVEGFYLLPAAGYVLLEQVQKFLQGEIQYDYGSLSSEEISDELEGDFRVMMEIYKQQFEDRDALINYAMWENNLLPKDGLASSALTNTQLDNCMQPEVFKIIDNQLRATYPVINRSFMNALCTLLNGYSVNIRDYIQGECLTYLAAYMNFFLSQEKTFMILCNSRSKARHIQDELSKILGNLNKVYSIWNVSDINDADSNADMGILVCCYHDMVNHRLVDKRSDFFNRLKTVIMTDGMEFCSQGNAQKDLIFAEIGKIQPKVNYVLISKDDNDYLRSAFEYYCGKELIPFNSDQMPPNMYCMIWKEESYCRVQKALSLGGDISPYLGVAIPLALTALKYDMPYVQILADRDKGFYTYKDALKMSRQQVNEYLGRELEIDNKIYYNDFTVNERENLEMLMIYDSEYNFYNLLWSWMKYGGFNKTMINIISPPYMLREYLASQVSSVLKSNNEFDAMISFQSGLDHTRSLALLLELCNAGLTEVEIMKKNDEYQWPHKNVTEVLAACLKSVIGQAEFSNIYECFCFEEQSVYNASEDRFIRSTLVTLSDENVRKRIQKRLVFAKLRTKNDHDEEIPILVDNLYNYFLEDQLVPINDYIYRINSVSNGMVTAIQESARERFNYYRSVEMHFDNMTKVDECLDLDCVDFNLCTADVSMDIYGYWESKRGIDFVSPHGMLFQYSSKQKNKDASVCLMKQQKKEQIRMMQIRLKKSVFTGDIQKSVNLAAFMFQELAKTMFPYNYMNLYVCNEWEAGEQFWENIQKNSEGVDMNDKIHSIVPFVQPQNIHGEVSPNQDDYINLYFVEFSSLEMGIVSNLYKNRMRLFEMALEYLNWYNNRHSAAVEEVTESIGMDMDDTAEEMDEVTDTETSKERDPELGPVTPSYLNLGGDSVASCFDLESFALFCEKIVLPNVESHVHKNIKISVSHAKCCSFCGRLSLFTYEMSDGRKMCGGCKDTQIDQKKEISELYQNTIKALREGYRLDMHFAEKIHLKMHSADSIRYECSKGRNTPLTGRVLGFYRPAKRELWIEARGPKNAVQSTLIHELSHSYQFDHMKVERLQKKNPTLALILLEGHTSYMEVDAMTRLGEVEYAKSLHEELMNRTDEYGIGYQLLRDYIEKKSDEGSDWTPYRAVEYLFDNLQELQDLVDNFVKQNTP